MIKVRFRKPGMDGFTRDIEMHAVPRERDTVKFDMRSYEVHAVEWIPHQGGAADFDVYIVLR